LLLVCCCPSALVEEKEEEEEELKLDAENDVDAIGWPRALLGAEKFI